MIRSFKDKEAEALWKTRTCKAYRGFLDQAYKRLVYLDAAVTLADLRLPPSNRFEALKGNMKGRYSLRINRQWRVVFKWREGATDVEITDYH